MLNESLNSFQSLCRDAFLLAAWVVSLVRCLNFSFLRQVWFVVCGNRLTSTLAFDLLVLFWCHAALAFDLRVTLALCRSGPCAGIEDHRTPAARSCLWGFVLPRRGLLRRPRSRRAVLSLVVCIQAIGHLAGSFAVETIESNSRLPTAMLACQRP